MSHALRRSVLSVALLSATALSTAEQAFAQAAAAEAAPSSARDPAQATALDAVVVTAQKREQVLKDVPISIAAVDGETIERENFTDFERLSTRIPGFFVQQQTDSSASFVMRGIEAGNAGAVSEPSISFFLNDVDTSRSRGMLKELFDIERVEVAKGPQGTLYGRGSQIGAVAVHTRKADPGAWSSSLEAQLGNYDLYSMTGVLNAPVVEDRLGLRVAVRRRERDGYATNVDGRKLNDDDLLAARASLRWLATPDLSFDLIVDHQADDDTAVMTKAINLASPGGDTSPFAGAAQNFYDPPQERRQTGVTLLADWQLGEAWSARSISAWRDVAFTESWDVDGTTYPFLIGRNLHDDQKILSQEFRLAYDAGGRFRSTFGAGYYNDRTYNLMELVINEQYLLAGFPRSTTPVTQLPVGGGVVLPVTEGVATLMSTRNDRDSWSAYLNVGYDLAPRWVLDAGVRYTRDEATIHNANTVYTVDGVRPIAMPNGLGNSLGQAFSNRGDYGLLQPRLAVTWRASDQVNLYAGVSRGLRAGYPQTSFAAPVDGVAQPTYGELKTEEVLNYEIGAKGTLGPGFYFEVTGFTYDYKDFQTRAVDLTVGTVNAGRASAYGLETTATWQATRDLTLSAAYAYLETEYDAFHEVVNGVLVDRAGNAFRMAPRHTASIGADWRRPLAGDWEVFANGHYAWRSKFYLNNDNLETEMQDAFGLFDLRLGVERYDGLRIEAYAENLFDREWVRDIGNGGKSFGLPTSIRANPRMVGLRLRMQW
ncbi:TonB-dependent receptor [Luteimonas sp. Y-2-2-4F]|nr:TonB-dependent receptor [Luteimonas sp. Y-2-2-4F]MCD9030847.1 TonB-dependent receptor [Luteimonas sp. Y-2-2-4F]